MQGQTSTRTDIYSFGVILYSGAGQPWDTHGNNDGQHRQLAADSDRAIAGLLQDLKQRGLLDDTLVIWGGEFGRTPDVRRAATAATTTTAASPIWLAGGGVKGGLAYGATDEFGFNAVEDKRPRPRPARHDPAPAGLRPREADLPLQRPRLPPDRRAWPRDSRHSCLTGRRRGVRVMGIASLADVKACLTVVRREGACPVVRVLLDSSPAAWRVDSHRRPIVRSASGSAGSASSARKTLRAHSSGYPDNEAELRAVSSTPPGPRRAQPRSGTPPLPGDFPLPLMPRSRGPEKKRLPTGIHFGLADRSAQLSQPPFPLGMNPGTPVSTTALNLTRNLIPSLISRTASSGRVETSKHAPGCHSSQADWGGVVGWDDLVPVGAGRRRRNRHR